MTSFVTSTDGTPIAFDRLGQGPPVVVVSGMFCARPTTRPLAELLAARFTVVNYDRRGRGESGDRPPYAVDREVDDLGALLAQVGGMASIYGHSSGAGLALRAAASGLPVSRLVLHEPPYGGDDEESTDAARQLAERVRAAIAAGRRGEAITMFMADMGMPPDVIEGMATDPGMLAVAPTMPYDHDVMGDFDRGGTIPEELVAAITVPTLVIAGGESPDFFRDTAARLADLLPDGTLTVLDGQDHGAPAEVVAPVVASLPRRLTPSGVSGRGRDVRRRGTRRAAPSCRHGCARRGGCRSGRRCPPPAGGPRRRRRAPARPRRRARPRSRSSTSCACRAHRAPCARRAPATSPRTRRARPRRPPVAACSTRCPGGTANIPKRNPPTDGKYAWCSGSAPSSGKCGASSAPHRRWNSDPGASAGCNPSISVSLATTALPSAS